MTLLDAAQLDGLGNVRQSEVVVPDNRVGYESQELTRNFVAHIRHLSEEGELPLFVWTLGFPRASLMRVLEECRLPCATLAGMSPSEFGQIEQLTPKSFHELRQMLFQQRTKLIDVVHADYLSRTLAGACFGSKPLWEDAGFQDDEEFSSFMRTFFAPLARNHKHCRHWKREIFKELYSWTHVRFSTSDLLLKCFLLGQ